MDGRWSIQLSCEHPVYDGLELQWFDDVAHGTGMLAFLTRRDRHVVDYYAQRGLRLDPAGYQLGAGTGVWVETDFADGRLEVSEDGMNAAALFTDADGRRIEVRVDDRDGRGRRRGGLLAPVSAAIEKPTSLFLVGLPAFDLVRTGGRKTVLRIDDIDLTVGELPGARLHRRRLIKYASPVVTIEVLPDSEPAAEVDDPVHQEPRGALRDGVVEAATGDGCAVRLEFDPPLLDLTALTDGAPRRRRWAVSAGGSHLTGGRWFAERRADGVHAGLDVTERWRPSKLPLLLRVVTAVVPVFRRWPTTYEWRAGFGQTAGSRLIGRGPAPQVPTTIVVPPVPDLLWKSMRAELCGESRCVGHERGPSERSRPTRSTRGGHSRR